MKRKFCLALVLVLMVIQLVLGGSYYASLESDASSDDIEKELEDTINDQLKDVDFSDFQDIIDNLTEDGANMFGNSSFWDKITKMLSGEFDDEQNSFFQAITNTFFKEIIGLVPIMATIIAVTLICSLISNIRGKESSSSVGQVIDFVCFGIIVVIISSVVVGLISSSSGLITSMQTQMNVLFPILLTFLAGVGGTVSVGIFQPAVAILSTFIVQIFVVVVIPLFVFQFVFIVVNNISQSVKLNKFISLCT